MTQMIIATRGISGSGKSTWALEQIAADPENFVRVNRDECRKTLFNATVLSGEEEQYITRVQHEAIRLNIKMGRSVLVDDTNTRIRTLRDLNLIALELGVEFKVRDFPVPLHLALKRNADRGEAGGRLVPEDVIRKQYLKFSPKGKFLDYEVLTEIPEVKMNDGWREYVPDTSLPKTYIFDIDGTLSLLGLRNPYDVTRVLEDTENFPVTNLLRMLKKAGYKIVITSGRSDACREDTALWLKQKGLEFDALFMRKAGDERKDAIIKNEIFEASIRPFYNVEGVYDDRDQVVKMWRAIGLFCAQVEYGDF